MPRTKRGAAQAAAAPIAPKPPTCARCGHELDWRDRYYVPTVPAPTLGAADVLPTPPLCKRCHQRGNQRQQRGFVKFTPAPPINRTTGRAIHHTGDFAAERIARWGEREARRLMAKRRGREQAQASRPKRWRRAVA